MGGGRGGEGKMFATVDYVEEMTAKESSKYGK